MLLESRRALSPCEAPMAAPEERTSAALAATGALSGTDSFDIVVYGIGRFAEYAPAHSSLGAPLTPALVRASIRSSSRSAQLQLACILAVAQEQCGVRLGGAPIDTSTAPSSSGSAPACDSEAASAARVFMYDPMLSELEKAVGEALGVRIIPDNEEGQTNRLYRPTASVTDATRCDAIRLDSTRSILRARVSSRLASSNVAVVSFVCTDCPRQA